MCLLHAAALPRARLASVVVGPDVAALDTRAISREAVPSTNAAPTTLAAALGAAQASRSAARWGAAGRSPPLLMMKWR